MLTNNFIVGTLAVLASSAFASKAAELPRQLSRAIRRRFLTTIEIDNTDEGFRWLSDYLSATAKSRWFGLRVIPPDGQRTHTAKAALYPRGFCWIHFKGKRIFAWITKEPLQHSSGYRETIELQCLFGSKQLFGDLVEEARRVSQGSMARGFDVYVPSGNHWRVADRKPARSLESVSLPDGVLDRVIADARLFVASEQKYLDRGIPYRRGYLFHGPPGNGKTTLAQMLACELGRNLSVLNLATIYSDEQLVDLMTNVPAGNIVSIEDIDAAFNQRTVQANHRISFSGLLNVLDGPMSRNGQIVVISTNHLDRLDPALIRPGRVDVKLELTNASAEQARSMHRRFFHGDHLGESSFAAAAAGCSMALVQCALVTAEATETDPASCLHDLIKHN